VRLSAAVDEQTVRALREAVDAGEFPGLSFKLAMEFLLTDGIVPESGLPVESFLRLEEWAVRRLEEARASDRSTNRPSTPGG
jgi:hypothetical protein